MSQTTINYPFTTPSNYIFDTDKIEVNGVAEIRRQKDTRPFTQTFDSDTGFIYDNTKAEFVAGKLQQKDKRPTNSVFYASYLVNQNATWVNGGGTPEGTLNGAAIVENGELNLVGNAYCQYNVDIISSLIQQGCIRIRWKPHYTGNAPAVQQLFLGSSNTTNSINIRHNSNLFQCYIYAGGVLMCDMSFAFAAVAETVYEVEVNFNGTSGNHRVLIDGITKKTDIATGTRSACHTYARIGSNSGQNSSILDVLLFNTEQHTANYTPDWSNIYETIFLESEIETPYFEKSGIGFIESLNNFITTQSGSLVFNIKTETGNYQYWDGLAWVDAGIGEYNDVTIMNTQLPNWTDIFEEIKFKVKIFFTNNSDTQSDIDFLETNHTDQEEFYTDNPPIEPTTTFITNELFSFIETSNKTGSDEIKHILKRSGDWYYFDGANWVISDETYAQSSLATDINSNIETFMDSVVGVTINVRSFLHSDDGSATPELDNLEIVYNDSSILVESVITGSIFDIGLDPPDITITVRPVSYLFGTISIITNELNNVVYDNETGLFTATIYVENVEPDELIWKFGTKEVRTKYLSGNVKFSDLARIYP